MGQFTVTTPVPGHSGKIGDVTFVDGVAVIDDDLNPSELAYCRNAGYGVVEAKAADAGGDSTDDDALRAELEDLGVKVDPRWKTKRLVTEVEKAREAKAADAGGDSTDDDETSDGQPGDNDEEITS